MFRGFYVLMEVVGMNWKQLIVLWTKLVYWCNVIVGSVLGKNRWREYKRILFRTRSMIRNFCSTHRLALSILFIFLLIWFFKPKLPNFLEIKDTSSAITILAVIVGALASILGIIIAILLVALEILRKTYTTYALRTLFENKQLKILFISYVSTIIVSILAIASLSDPLEPRDIGLTYFSLYLFIICISTLFPYSKQIIASSESKERITNLVNRIHYSAVSYFSRFRPPVSPKRYIASMETNPIFILSEVSIRALKDDDRLIPNFVLFESTNKLLNMLDTADDKRETINAFLIILKNTARVAIRSRQEGILRSVIYCIEGIHDFCAEKRIPWHEVIELNEFLEDMLEDSIKVGLGNTVGFGFSRIQSIMKVHLDKNIPGEDEISDLHIRTGKKVPHDTEKTVQWDQVSTEYIRMISNLVEKSIEYKFGQAVSTGLFTLKTIASGVIGSELGDLQKEQIVADCYFHAKSLTLKCVDENLYRRITGLSPFNFHDIIDALKKETAFSRIPLGEFSDLIIKLAQKSSLDTFVLNQLAGIGRYVVGKLDGNKLYKEALLFIIDVLNRLREIIEKDLSEEKKRIYLAINSQTESLKDWMKHGKKKDKNVETKLNTVLSKFSKVEMLRRELSEKTVRWPDLTDKKKEK